MDILQSSDIFSYGLFLFYGENSDYLMQPYSFTL